jgi:SAM-dependent methyltransferase
MSRREEKTGGAGIMGKRPRGLRGLARMATLNARVDNIVGNLGSLRSRLDNNRKEIDTLRKQVKTLSELNEQVKTLDSQVQLQNRRLTTTTRELETLRAWVKELKEHSPADFKRLGENWEELGRRAPLWAILSLPEKRNKKWNISEFFESGEREIAGVLEYVESLDILQSRRRVLDFGCGVGRLTQALCRHFDECCGVDIAPSMIQLAEEYNSYGSRCRYYVNDSDDLSLFEDNTFDFIYSNIVLQHMKPKYSKRYIKEFLRILAPEGVLVFQIPSEPASVGEALPDSAFMARISPHVSSIKVEAGSQTTIRATVKNVSDTTWHSLGRSFNGKHQVKLGNHWLDDSGKAPMEDGRTNLPKDLKPTEEIDLDLIINAPQEPGDYILELDMVQEMVAWFKDKGSETAKIGVRTTSSQPVANSGRLVPKIEMHSVPKQEILELLTSCGGKVVDVQEGFDVGVNLPENPASDWLHFRYCVTKLRQGDQKASGKLESVEL